MNEINIQCFDAENNFISFMQKIILSLLEFLPKVLCYVYITGNNKNWYERLMVNDNL